MRHLPELAAQSRSVTAPFTASDGAEPSSSPRAVLSTSARAAYPIAVTSPLPPGSLRFGSMRWSAGLSALGAIELQLLSEDAEIEPEDLLGQTIGLEITLGEGVTRHLGGYVTGFGLGPSRGRFHGYQAQVRPWLWFLDQTDDCRIFQDLSVPEIVEQVFADHGDLPCFEFKLTRSYRKREYCVQYRESDFNFVARLLEDEGIYWFFEHAAGRHKLMLLDANGMHSAAPGCERLPYMANAGAVLQHVEHVADWQFRRNVRSGRRVLRSYNFETPALPLEVAQRVERAHPHGDAERFDYQGDYRVAPDGQHLADMQLDEAQAAYEHASGATNAGGLTSGSLFTLSGHPRDDQNRVYLCTGTSLSASVGAWESIDAADAAALEALGGGIATTFECRFDAIPATQQFRAPRLTRKPFVQGPQTAVVVGPAGDEIHTDRHGRVKVQFHWDRRGHRDQHSSCWMRVSSPWAGKGFGFIQIPRIGQEVVVDFLEGDPDQPLVTGRVYNADQMPPWALPEHATQSGVLTRSSLGGTQSHANALRFEDLKGSEQVWLHAEKDQLIEVENDETHTVGNDRRKSIVRDETTQIGRNRKEDVGGTHTETITGHRTVHVTEGAQSNVVRQDIRIESVDGSILITAPKQIDLRVGNSVISITDGAIKIVGPDRVDINP